MARGTRAVKGRRRSRPTPADLGRSGVASSVGRSAESPAGEEAGLPLRGEELIQPADGEDWPAHFGAARLGIP